MDEYDRVNRKAAFDLEQKKDLIKKKFNLPLDLRLSFDSSEEDVFIGIKELEEPFISVSKTVFLRAINDEGCYETGNFEIMVEHSPKINILENLMLC